MSAPDDVMARIGQAIELSHSGQREQARQLFDVLWEEIGPDGDPLHRVSVAHWMADVQDDLRAELEWDLRAFQAAGEVTDERARHAGAASPVAAFYPSLHLNLGEDYRKLGDLDAARRHLQFGQAAAANLGSDEYGTMIRGGLQALADRIDGHQPAV